VIDFPIKILNNRADKLNTANLVFHSDLLPEYYIDRGNEGMYLEYAAYRAHEFLCANLSSEFEAIETSEFARKIYGENSFYLKFSRYRSREKFKRLMNPIIKSYFISKYSESPQQHEVYEICAYLFNYFCFKKKWAQFTVFKKSQYDDFMVEKIKKSTVMFQVCGVNNLFDQNIEIPNEVVIHETPSVLDAEIWNKELNGSGHFNFVRKLTRVK